MEHYPTEKLTDLSWQPAVGDVVFVIFEAYADGDTFGSTERTYKYMTTSMTREMADFETTRLPRDSGYFGGHIEFEIHEVVVQDW